MSCSHFLSFFKLLAVTFLAACGVKEQIMLLFNHFKGRRPSRRRSNFRVKLI